MSASTQQTDQIVSAAIREISHIATLPEITLRIVELVEDPKSTAQDLHNVISNDPALSARILKVVNSSFYGLPGQIGSINRAIVMLGLNAVKNIAIAASLAKLFRGGELTSQFSAKKLWEHSVHTAATMKLLADRLRLGFADEAFLAGLIHDIGVMVEMQYDRTRLIDVIHAVGPDANGVPCNDMIEAETSIFGAPHTHFGAALAERWKFPRNFVLTARYHHNPFDAPAEARLIPALVALADRLVAELPGAYRLDLPDTSIPQDLLDAVHLASDALQEIRDSLPEHIKTSGDILA